MHEFLGLPVDKIFELPYLEFLELLDMAIEYGLYRGKLTLADGN